MKRRGISLLIFCVFLLSGYSIAGYTRHYSFEKDIDAHIQSYTNLTQNGENIEDLHSFIYEEDYEFRGSPEGALVASDPVFKDEIYALEITRMEYSEEYQTKVLPSLLEEFDGQEWNLWHTYKWFAISKQLRRLIYGGSNLVMIPPSVGTELGCTLAESIALWEQSGGKREGDWMTSYKQSPEYETWLNTQLQEFYEPKERTPPPEPLSPEDKAKYEEMLDKKIDEALRQGKSKDDPEVQSLLLAKELLQIDLYAEEREEIFRDFQVYEPMSIEERYHAVTHMVELPLSGRILCSDFLKANQRMVEISYNRYLNHAADRDIVRAGIDAWIVEIGGNFHVRTGKVDFNALEFLNDRGFRLTNFLIDMCVIIGLSAVLTFIIRRKFLLSLSN
jgi:hypothetical protein